MTMYNYTYFIHSHSYLKRRYFVMDLETILQNFGYKKVFKKDGTLSVDGNKAYGNLIEIIYNLQSIGVISNANKIIDKLDKVLSEN